MGAALLPAMDRPVVPLPRMRRAAFRANLRRFLRTGGTGAERTDPAPASPLVQAGCGVCRGHCCRLGQNHAFLDGSDFGGLAGADAYRWYVRMLPPESVEGSCVFHGPLGCVLPRERRAPICNRYECDGLDQAAVSGARRLAAVDEDGRILREVELR